MMVVVARLGLGARFRDRNMLQANVARDSGAGLLLLLLLIAFSLQVIAMGFRKRAILLVRLFRFLLFRGDRFLRRRIEALVGYLDLHLFGGEHRFDGNIFGAIDHHTVIIRTRRHFPFTCLGAREFGAIVLADTGTIRVEIVNRIQFYLNDQIVVPCFRTRCRFDGGRIGVEVEGIVDGEVTAADRSEFHCDTGAVVDDRYRIGFDIFHVQREGDSLLEAIVCERRQLVFNRRIEK